MSNQDLMLTTEGCRYCLMCRHVCPVTRVTYNEATSPHGWALEIASVRRGLLQWNPETTNLLYQCVDCGLCQSFCVTDQPLPYAIVGARADVVAEGHAPPAVLAVDEALRQWSNPYGPLEGVEEPKQAATAVYIGAAAWHQDRAGVEAICKLLDVAALDYTLVGVGRSTGYLAYTLGLRSTATALALATVAEVRRTGARRLVVLGSQQMHTFKHVYPLLGIEQMQEVEIVDFADLLAATLEEGWIRVKPAEAAVAYHDPCQTPRLAGRWEAPRRLLAAALSAPPREGFWREKRAANCGASGGLPWTQPALAAKLARASLDDAALHGANVVLTDAPECLSHLRAHAAEQAVEVRGLYEFLADQVVGDED